MTVGRLTEHNLEHCAVALYKEQTRGHTVMGETKGSQYNFQLAICSRQIAIREGGLGMRGKG